MPGRTLLLRAAALAALTVLAAGCADRVGAGESVSGKVAEQGYVSGDGTTTILAESERLAAPDLTGADFFHAGVRPAAPSWDLAPENPRGIPGPGFSHFPFRDKPVESPGVFEY